MNQLAATTINPIISTLPINLSEAFFDEDFCGLEDRSLLDVPVIRYTFWVLYIIVFVGCLFGNLFTILVLCTHPSMRTPTNFFLANLAGADLLVALFCILQNMIHIVGHENGNWFFGAAFCKAYLYVLHMVPCTSVGILMCVSIEKYIAVLHPLVALKTLTKRLRTMLAIGVWTISLIANFPFLKTAQLYTFDSKSFACGRDHEYSLELLVVVSFVLWYVIPVLTLAFIYTRIGLVLWKSGEGISNRASTESQTSGNGGPGSSWYMSNGRVIVYQQNSLLQVPDNDQRRATEKRREVRESRRKVIRLLFAIVLSFAVFTLPHHFRLLHSTFSKSHTCLWHWSHLFQPLSYLSLFFSSTINPILYAFLSKRFRAAAQDFLHCRRCPIWCFMSTVASRTQSTDGRYYDGRYFALQRQVGIARGVGRC
ncbi:unnamed protein product, partial [Mesorhabditis belari]|uniref:G-protein coupled receptors family 1 profile domain-containing protein n=1 Tax=Mesorhabditis belari TaxID=2138241 RepID=A0AAF3F062_9BILA